MPELEDTNTEDLYEPSFNLSNVFNEKGDEVPAEPAEEVKAEPVVEPVVEKEEVKEPEKKDPVKGLEAGIAAERRKRQEAEAKALQLENYIKSLEKPKEETVNLFDDPEKRLQQFEAKINSSFEKRLIDLSASNCALRHDDYQDVENVFIKMANDNPSLVNQMLSQPDPAEWAYQQARKQKTLAEIGDDPEKYKASLREQLKAELLAELKNEPIENKIQALNLPPSANSFKGKIPPREIPKISDDPLGDVFKGR